MKSMKVNERGLGLRDTVNWSSQLPTRTEHTDQIVCFMAAVSISLSSNA